MNNIQQYSNIFKNRYFDKPDALGLFDHYFKNRDALYTLEYENQIVGGIFRYFLKDKDVMRVGNFVVNPLFEGKQLGTKIIQLIPKEVDTLAFCNIHSKNIFAREGWLTKSVFMCNLNKEDTPFIKVDEPIITSWIQSRYIDHYFFKSYKIFSYNQSVVILKKYNNTCHIMECDFEKFEKLLPAIKHIAFNEMKCDQLTFWDNMFITSNIEKLETATTVVFSNENTLARFNNRLYMGLSDVY